MGRTMEGEVDQIGPYRAEESLGEGDKEESTQLRVRRRYSSPSPSKNASLCWLNIELLHPAPMYNSSLICGSSAR